jgi:molybdopterin molybdotransferase
LIAFEEAKALVTTHCHALSLIEIDLNNSIDAVLAEDVLSPIDFPSFPQSAMDGYAIRFSDFVADESLHVTGEVQAGSGFNPAYKDKSAVRIFTGAPVPADYDTVVMQEHCNRNGDELFISSPKLVRGMNVRAQGSEIKAGEQALQKGTLLTAGAIGFLIGLGITTVKVYSKPKVRIIVTGKELIQAGNPLAYGQIYESNGCTLLKALQHLHINDVEIAQVDDDPLLIKEQIQQAISNADLLLLSGGVSVGDYDFVSAALQQAGVDIIFHKVKQKPGKPVLFGKLNNCIVFGLPGNPSSVLTCFYEYVTIALQQMTGRSTPYYLSMQVMLKSGFQKPAGLTHFLKGIVVDNTVSILPAQESFRLSSFSIANCLVQVPSDTTDLKENDLVTIQLLPV